MKGFWENLDKELYPEYEYPKNQPIENEEFRPEIAALGKKITDRIPQKLGLKKITSDDPEYWGLARVITKEEAEVALKMKVRVPQTLDQIVELTGIEKDKLKKLLDSMSTKGLLEYNKENENHELQYVLPMYVPGSAEFFNMNGKLLKQYPEMGTFFERMSRLPLEKVTKFVPEGGAGIGMHVIPVEKEVNMHQDSIDLEHISYWLDKYDGKYAKSPCSCRRSRLTHGEGCADDPEGWCIAIGDMADYVVESNKDGVYVDKNEVLDILKQAEDNGFVHQITNIDGENKIFAICNCNVNVCYALRTSQLFNTPNLSRSAYTAKTDREKCVACGKCVEVCPAGAVKLGQKLCHKDGSNFKYKHVPLPQDQKWDESMWTHNYRDVNRINCYDTGTSPCKTACPAHIAIQGYLQKAKKGKYDEALALIKQDNPLPAICGRICNKRCEDACTRGEVDDPIAIDDVKRYIAELDLNSKTRYIPKKIIPSLQGGFDEKIAIIGSGPAGLSCAYYLCLMGYKPTVFEKNPLPGGMLTYGIPSFKLENSLIQAEVDVIKELGAEFIFNTEIGKDVTLKELRDKGYKGFFVAIGCSEGRYPNIENDHASGCISAQEFLHSVNDGNHDEYSGNTVVIGGGNVAIDAARCAKRMNKSGDVSIYSLESRNEVPARDDEIQEAQEEDIAFNYGWGPKNIILDSKRQTAGIVLKKCVSVFDENGKFNPKYDENETIELECSKVIFAIGQAIDWGKLIDGENLDLLPNRGPISNKLTQQTSVDDVFVGGDVAYGPRFAIDAIASGREGAISLHRFVHENCTLTIGRNRRDFKELNKKDITMPKNISKDGRQSANTQNDNDNLSWNDDSKTLDEVQIKTETNRCLACGVSYVDPNKCIGCGLCTTKCLFDAIHLVRDHPNASKMVPSEDKLKYIFPNMVKRPIKVLFK